MTSESRDSLQQSTEVQPDLGFWHRLKRRLPKMPGTVENLIRLVGATVFGQSLTVLAAPILTRLYTPEDFGVFAVYSALIVALTPIATLRYEYAIPLPRDNERGKHVLVLCVLLAVFTGLLVALPSWLLHKEWIQVSFLTPILPWWWFVPIAVAAIGIYQSLSQWTIRTKQFSVLAKTKVRQGIGAVGTQLLLGLLGVGPAGLFTGQILGQSAGIGVLSRTVRGTDSLSRPGKLRSRFRFRDIWQVAARYRRFPFLSMPSAFLNALVLSLPAFVLSAYYEPAAVGLYALTSRVAGIPMTFVGRAVANVYVGETADLLRNTPERIRGFFYSSLRKMAVIGFLGIGLPLVGARYVIPFVFGPEWADAGHFLQLLAPMYTMQFIASPFGGMLEVLERQDLFLVREVSRVIIVGFALWFGSSTGKPIDWTIGLFGVAGFLGYVLYLYVAKVAVDDWQKRRQHAMPEV